MGVSVVISNKYLCNLSSTDVCIQQRPQWCKTTYEELSRNCDKGMKYNEGKCLFLQKCMVLCRIWRHISQWSYRDFNLTMLFIGFLTSIQTFRQNAQVTEYNPLGIFYNKWKVCRKTLIIYSLRCVIVYVWNYIYIPFIISQSTL